MRHLERPGDSSRNASISRSSDANLSRCLFSLVRFCIHPRVRATSLYPPWSRMAWCTSHRRASSTSDIAGITGASSPPPLSGAGGSNVSAPETSL